MDNVEGFCFGDNELSDEITITDNGQPTAAQISSSVDWSVLYYIIYSVLQFLRAIL
jgi:hypothetical protein